MKSKLLIFLCFLLFYVVLVLLVACAIQWMWAVSGAGTWTSLGEMPYPVAVLLTVLLEFGSSKGSKHSHGG